MRLVTRGFTRRYSAEHEWIEVAKDGRSATLGISDYAQSKLGDVVHLELPEVGQKFKTHDSMGTIESAKAVSQIFAPVGLEVLAVNSDILNDLKKVNDDAERTWLIKGRIDNEKELNKLMTPDAYNKLDKH